jgi:peptidyl-prolyl cis-trans isomerase C
MKSRKLCIYRFIVVLMFMLNGVIYASEIAKVDDLVITSETVASALKALGHQGEMVAANPELRKRFIDHMINSALIARKARADGFEKDPKYQARLADVASQLLAGEYLDRIIEQKSGDKDIRVWFEKNKKLFSKKEIHAKHILCDDEATAQKALQEATKNPADFDKIAQKYSKDKTVDLGFFGRGRMAPEFEAAAYAIKPQTIGRKPIKTNFGWHVIFVVETRGDETVAFEAVKPEVLRRYRQSVQENFVHELRSKSKIAINEQNLKEIKLP